MQYLAEFFSELIKLTNEMSVYLLMGFLFAGILHVFIKKDTISRYLGKRNLKSVLYASILGIPLPLCSCGVIPTGISFYRDGASKGSTVSFLISTPQTGVDSILVTYSLMGLPFTIIRPIIALITGVFGGFVTNLSDKTPEKETECINCSCDDDEDIGKNSFVKMLKYGFVEFLNDISNWLVIGLVLAALISVLIPDNFFRDQIGNDFLGMLIILVASVPFYVCATASVPIAVVLLMKGISPGAALIFLMAGPATNIATMTILGNTLGRKTLIMYLLSIIGGALVFGLLIDNLLNPEWFLSSIRFHSESHQHLLPDWIRIGSSILLVLLILNGFIRDQVKKFKSKRIQKLELEPETNMKKIKVKVGGMTCGHCKATIEKSLSEVAGINQADADVNTGEVTIVGEDFDIDVIKKKIIKLGYVNGEIAE